MRQYTVRDRRPMQPPTYRAPRRKPPRKILIVIGLVLTALCVWGILALAKDEKKTPPSSGSNTQNSTAASGDTGDTPTAFDKQKYSTTQASSLWVIANKQHQLQPASYTPADLTVPNVPLRLGSGAEEMHLRAEAATALEELVAAAKQENIKLMLASGYRSYNFQKNLYAGYVRTQGQAAADTQSARAGHSEHQTGLAADVGPTNRQCEVEQCFGDLPEGKWVAANAYKFGFIIRYTADKEDVTGYIYEPWHLRYVGTELAAELHRTGTETLEEFFNVTGGKKY
jgi:D-alanyl-D-alanine carboxypeptidase